MRILIIDDSADQRKLYQFALRDISTEITEVSSGVEALALNWPKDFDVVLLDVLMPNMAGDEVLREALRRWGSELPPVVVFTALDPAHLERLALTMPGADSINLKIGTKTGVLDTLRSKIYEAVDRSPWVGIEHWH